MRFVTRRTAAATTAIAVAASLCITASAAADPAEEAENTSHVVEDQTGQSPDPVDDITSAPQATLEQPSPTVASTEPEPVEGAAPEWVPISGISFNVTDKCLTTAGVKFRGVEWSSVLLPGRNLENVTIKMDIYQPAQEAGSWGHSKTNPWSVPVPSRGDVAIGSNEYRYHVQNDITAQTWTSAWLPLDIESCIVSGKWELSGGVWYYRFSNGSYAKGWQEIDGLDYYFTSSGRMVTGWLAQAGDWYYFAPSGHMVTGWLSMGATWYFLRPDGRMATGWLNQGGSWYYLAGSGAMVTGWLQVAGTWYLFNGSGRMLTGWQNQGGSWYYLRANGSMVTGRQYIDGRQSDFDRNGVWLGYVSSAPASNGSSGSGSGGGGSRVYPSAGVCPPTNPIKGNRGDKEWIYHVPGGASYAKTNPEECFSTESAARAAGYRAAKR